jgi:hypothetical protein
VSAIALAAIGTVADRLDVARRAMNGIASRDENPAGKGQHYKKLFHLRFLDCPWAAQRAWVPIMKKAAAA